MPRIVFRTLAIACAACLVIASEARADEPAKSARHPIARSAETSRSANPATSGWSSMFAIGVAGALAAFGVFAFLAKRTRDNPASANLRVVGRTNLSPRHVVYLLQVGDRTLILGTGGPGPPSLLGELKPGETLDAPSSSIPAPHVVPTARVGGVA